MAYQKKPIVRMMIDAETLAVAPNAAIIQFGAVFMQGAIPVVKEFSISPEAYKTLEGFEIDQNTINFHYKVNRANYENCLNSHNSVHDMADFIEATFAEAALEGTVELWCCGTDFDVPILSNFLKTLGRKVPWSYSKVRDYRTLRELYKQEVPCETTNDHSAARDAVNQHKHLRQLFLHLGKTF